MAKLSTINGIEAAFVQQLAASGIETSDQLLRDGATPEARSAVTNASGVDPVQLLVWVCRIDLERIKGVAWDYARLLTGSGVTTVPDLATRTAEKLHSQIGATNRAHKLVRRPPTLVQVRDWIDQARELAAIVTLEAGEDERVVGYGVDGSSATLLATSTTTVVTTMVLATDDEPDATASDVLLATSDQGEAVTQEQRSLVRLATLKGMDATVAERLRVVGVETPWELLRRGARWQDRATLLREADLTETQVLYWLYQADLERVDGVAWEYAGLLAGAGVTTVPDLAQRDPQQLHLVLLRANAEHGFVQRPPTTAQLHSWVRHAGTLPALITFGAADADEALIPPGLALAAASTAPQVAGSADAATVATSDGEPSDDAASADEQLTTLAYGVNSDGDEVATNDVVAAYDSDSVRTSGGDETSDDVGDIIGNDEATSDDVGDIVSDDEATVAYGVNEKAEATTTSSAASDDTLADTTTRFVGDYGSGIDTTSGDVIASYTNNIADTASAAHDTTNDNDARVFGAAHDTAVEPVHGATPQDGLSTIEDHDGVVEDAAPVEGDLPPTGIDGLDEAVVARLAAHGVTTSERLLERGASWEGRAALAYEAGISQIPLMEWLHRADLRRLSGIDAPSADLLVGAGVASLPDLAQRNPDELLAVLWTVHQQRGGATPPSRATLASWIEQAHGLAPLLTFPPTEVY